MKASRRKFTLWHSLLGTVALLIAEGALAIGVPTFNIAIVLVGATIGGLVTLYVSTEVIEEVRNDRHMLMLLTAVVGQSIIFFGFQYVLLMLAQPTSFPTLEPNIVSIMLQSTMVFVFNPLYLPATGAGRALLLINTLGALGLVLFILQNIRQFRGRD